MVGRNLANEILRHQFLDSCARKTAVDLQTLRNHGSSDQAVRRDLLQQFVIGGLIKEHRVVQLFLCLSLRPFLFWSRVRIIISQEEQNPKTRRTFFLALLLPALPDLAPAAALLACTCLLFPGVFSFFGWNKG